MPRGKGDPALLGPVASLSLQTWCAQAPCGPVHPKASHPKASHPKAPKSLAQPTTDNDAGVACVTRGWSRC